MKRLIALTILVVFVGFIAIFGNITSKKYYNYNKKQLQKCITNSQNATLNISNIKREFNKNKNFLYIYGNRRTINNIKTKIEELETNIKYNSKKEIELNYKELLELIDSFCSEEQLKIENFY